MLRCALEFVDPLLTLFAVISRLRVGRAVQPSDISAVAASVETRGCLFQWLLESGRLLLFPAEFRTQESLAEYDMVH